MTPPSTSDVGYPNDWIPPRTTNHNGGVYEVNNNFNPTTNGPIIIALRVKQKLECIQQQRKQQQEEKEKEAPEVGSGWVPKLHECPTADQ